ncbi:formate dehydrogenase accessory sulfurtransferase FdhD [Tissierellaceae bacterium HCP3S3_D8]
MLKNKLPSAVEMPVELLMNDNIITTFMCTPSELDELAIGHLLTRGIIENISDIVDIQVNLDTCQIFTTVNNPMTKDLYSVPEFILSGTSSVSKFNDNIYRISKVNQDLSVELTKIIEIANIMVDEAVIYNTTGGVHSAIVLNLDKDRYYLREDIGRHCAVDKAIGASAKNGENFSNSIVCTTGRISLDMLLKCAAVGIPVVASLKYPSDMGIKLANHYGITIVSKILSDTPLIYTNPEKIQI